MTVLSLVISFDISMLNNGTIVIGYPMLSDLRICNDRIGKNIHL